MEDEKIEELISYLASMEFGGEKLEAEIRKNIKQGLPYFSARHQMDYGDEQMFYDLRFRKDHQFDAYRLEGYKATYRKPVEINHQVINGIDTEDLESRMKEIDWQAHFEKQDSVPDDGKTAKIISDLLTLDYNHDQDGIKIQELLQFKYFPERYFDERLKELQIEYDHSREFTATENNLCNVHLAYHLISGRLNDLYEKLQYLGLQQYPGIDVYPKLELFLSGNPGSFEINCFRNEAEGYTGYCVPTTQVEGSYTIDTYTVTLTPYPPIEHGVYNGIDTQKLEDRMREIDWHNDSKLFVLQDDSEPELLSEIERITSQIYELSQDAKGIIASQQLQLKYWADASFLESLIEQKTWDYLESLPKRVQQFPVEMKARTAFNLLCGRAAMNFSPNHPSERTDIWMKLDLGHKDENGNYPVKTIEGFPMSDLEKRLDSLPIDNINFYSIRNALKQGDLLSVRLNDNKKVMLQANPEQKTIDIFTPDMHPIYANLRLDPDWKPSVMQKENGPEMNQKMLSKSKQNYFSKQSKKRHKKGRRM